MSSKTSQSQLTKIWSSKVLDSLGKPEFADVIFLVGPLGEEVYAHKLILSAGSPVFETMFSSRWNGTEKFQAIELPDVEPVPFRLFLRFLYNQCRLTNKEISSIPLEHMLDLIYIARKYDIGYVVDILLRALKQRLDVDHAISIYQQAQDFGETEIENAAFEFIVRRLGDILETPRFNSLRQQNVCKILAIDDLDIKEVSLFQAACRWAAAECKRVDLEVNPHNYRTVLGNALDLIRFPTMKSEDLTFQVSNCGILTSEEMVEILKYISLPLDSRTTIKNLKYNTTPRRGYQNDIQLIWLRRHGVFEHIYILHSSSWFQTCFMVNQKITLKGLGLALTFHDEPNSVFTLQQSSESGDEDQMETDDVYNNNCEETIEVNLDISQTDNSHKAFATCGKFCRHLRITTPLTYIAFDTPVEIQPNIIHTISYMFEYKQKELRHHLISLGDKELNVSPASVQAQNTKVNFDFLVTKGNDHPYLECPIRELAFTV